MTSPFEKPLACVEGLRDRARSVGRLRLLKPAASGLVQLLPSCVGCFPRDCICGEPGAQRNVRAGFGRGRPETYRRKSVRRRAPILLANGQRRGDRRAGAPLEWCHASPCQTRTEACATPCRA